MSFADRALPYRDGYRIAPNFLVRSSLFASLPCCEAREKCTDDYHIRIATIKGMSASQTNGMRLDQADLDVLLTIFAEFALTEALNDVPIESIDMPIGGLLVASGRLDGGKNRLWLRNSLQRLSSARLSLSTEDCTIAMTDQALVNISPLTDTRYRVVLPANVRKLFDSGFVGIQWPERQQLSHLGKWLHAYYSSHKKKPYRMGARLIGQLSGWTGLGGNMAASFPTTLSKELKALALITGWRCDFELKSERLAIEKQDDGVGGNAATAQQYRNHDFSEEVDVNDLI